VPKKNKKKKKASKRAGQPDVIAGIMIQTSTQGKTIEDKLRREIDRLSHEILVNTFAKEVLDFKVEQVLTREEIEYSEKLLSYLRELRTKSDVLEKKDNAEWIEAWDKYESEKKKVHQQNEGLFLKMRNARKIQNLSTRARITLKEDRKSARDLSDTDLKDYILLVRLLKYVTTPFNLNRYLETLFRGRQKGRAFKAYVVH
jgi:ribosomal protein L19